jgi:hypothetical protein
LQKEVTMYQPDPSNGRPLQPLRPLAHVPAPMLAAVKFMHAGTAVGAVPLLIEPVTVSGYLLVSRACRVPSASRRVPLPG